MSPRRLFVVITGSILFASAIKHVVASEFAYREFLGTLRRMGESGFITGVRVDVEGRVR